MQLKVGLAQINIDILPRRRRRRKMPPLKTKTNVEMFSRRFFNRNQSNCYAKKNV